MMRVALTSLFLSTSAIATCQVHKASPCAAALDKFPRHSSQPAPRIARCESRPNSKVVWAVVVAQAGKSSPEYGSPVSQLNVLEKRPDRWVTVLTIQRQIENSAGVIAADYIDPNARALHWVKINHTDTSGLRLVVFYAQPNGQPDKGGVPVEIGWNQARSLFEEVATDGSGFISERKRSELPLRKLRLK